MPRSHSKPTAVTAPTADISALSRHATFDARNMINFTRRQLDELQEQKTRRFALEVDDMLGRTVGAPWVVIAPELRLQRLDASCTRGLALGITQEVYLAQFAMLHAMAGEAFLARPQARAIIGSETMGWREKLYQLIALAGVDITQGVDSAAPAPTAAA